MKTDITCPGCAYNFDIDTEKPDSVLLWESTENRNEKPPIYFKCPKCLKLVEYQRQWQKKKKP